MARLLLAAGGLALIALWFFRPGAEETAAPIERRAGLDLVAACNEAAAEAGAPQRFSPADVLPDRLEPAEGPGVVTLASRLEARRDGLTCHWDGIDAPRLTPVR